MKAFRIKVQVKAIKTHEQYSAFWRAGQRWEAGLNEAVLTVVPKSELVNVPKAVQDKLFVGTTISEQQYQGLIDEPALAVLVLKLDQVTLEPPAIEQEEQKTSALDAAILRFAGKGAKS